MQLKFTLQGQRLIRTDKLRPVADSKNFLGAEFEFSHQWSGCEKTAIFKSSDGDAFSVLLNEDKCAVPYEVSGGEFYVSVFGIKDEMRITSDEISVFVEVSGYTEGETPQEPTQTVYEQILNRISESEAMISEELDTSVQALSTEIQESESRLSDGLQNLSTQLTQSIDTHTTDTNIHISADERELWNTVSDKAEQSDHELLQTQADNIETILKTKAHQSDVQALQSQADEICNRITDNECNISDLQAQIGDIETALDNIIGIQNTLIGGDSI